MNYVLDGILGLVAIAFTVAAARYVAPGITDAYRRGNAADVRLYVTCTFVFGAVAGTLVYGIIMDIAR